MMRKQHFSLIEVLIAIGIIASIMAVSYGFMRQGLHVRNYSETVSRRLRLEHNLLGVITKDIQSAQWIPQSPTPIFSIKPDSLHPSSSRLELLGYSRLYNSKTNTSTYLNRISYALDLLDNGEDYALYRRKKNTMSSVTYNGGWEYIYGPIAHFTLTVWDAQKKEWVDTFSSTTNKKLPSVVRIRIELPPEGDAETGDVFQRKIVLYDRLPFKKASIREDEDIPTDGTNANPDTQKHNRPVLPGA